MAHTIENMRTPMALVVDRTRRLLLRSARMWADHAALCLAALWMSACSAEGLPQAISRGTNTAPQAIAGRTGATAGVPGAGCVNCAGAMLPTAGLGTSAGS